MAQKGPLRGGGDRAHQQHVLNRFGLLADYEFLKPAEDRHKKTKKSGRIRKDEWVSPVANCFVKITPFGYQILSFDCL